MTSQRNFSPSSSQRAILSQASSEQVAKGLALGEAAIRRVTADRLMQRNRDYLASLKADQD